MSLLETGPRLQREPGAFFGHKIPMAISFFIPAYNCAATLEASVLSVLEGNFEPGDELLVADDGSTDQTPRLLAELASAHPALRVLRHARNLGGGAARNTCVREARHPYLFCLDSDNLLAPRSVRPLLEFLVAEGADVAAFGALHYFMDDPAHVSHTSVFKPGAVTLEDCLGEPLVPGSSGNYLFTRKSWIRAGGYPETARALDAWGFGLRQVATGARMLAMPGSHYFHRIGHASYYVREARRNDTSLLAARLLLPFLDLLEPAERAYLHGDLGREIWFSQLDERPIRVRAAGLDPEKLRARSAQHPPDRMATLLEERLVEPVSHAPLSYFAGRLWSATTSYPCADGVPIFQAAEAPNPVATGGRWLHERLAASALADLPTLLYLGPVPGPSHATPYAYRLTGKAEGPNSEAAAPHQVVARAEALPFAAGSVDAVLSPGILERTDNPLLALLEIHRVLKPDGLLMIETRPASALAPEVTAVLDAAFVAWYLEPLFEPKHRDASGLVLGKRPEGRLWVTDEQLLALGRRLARYRLARSLEAAGQGAESQPLYRQLAQEDVLLPSEAPRMAYALLRIASPAEGRALQEALAHLGGSLAAELLLEPIETPRPWSELRERLGVAGVLDAGKVLGLLAQLAQAIGAEALASDLADWSVAAS